MPHIRALFQWLALLILIALPPAHAQQLRNESLGGTAPFARYWVDADNDGRDDYC